MTQEQRTPEELERAAMRLNETRDKLRAVLMCNTVGKSPLELAQLTIAQELATKENNDAFAAFQAAIRTRAP